MSHMYKNKKIVSELEKVVKKLLSLKNIAIKSVKKKKHS